MEPNLNGTIRSLRQRYRRSWSRVLTRVFEPQRNIAQLDGSMRSFMSVVRKGSSIIESPKEF